MFWSLFLTYTPFKNYNLPKHNRTKTSRKNINIKASSLYFRLKKKQINKYKITKIVPIVSIKSDNKTGACSVFRESVALFLYELCLYFSSR